VAIVVCDSRNKIRMVNQRLAALLKSSRRMLGGNIKGHRTRAIPRLHRAPAVDLRFPGAEGRWQIISLTTGIRVRPAGLFIADSESALGREIAACNADRVIGPRSTTPDTRHIHCAQTLNGCSRGLTARKSPPR